MGASGREDLLNTLSKEIGISPRSIERLLGSIRVSVSSQVLTDSAGVTREVGATTYEIGFTILLQLSALKATAAFETVKKALSGAAQEYQSACPLITAWIARGDFDPKRIPEQISRAQLLHACRTVSRLKAKFLRQVSAQ